VRLKFSGDIKASKMYPSPLPDLYKGEQLVVVGRYAGKGSAAVTIEGSVNGATRKFSEDIELDGRDSDSDFIPRLWATRRVGYLLDEIRLHGENKELKDEVTDLAREYGIVTPYTASLIVEDESKKNVPMAMRSMQRFDQDRDAREGASRGWESYKSEKSGDAAVGGARSAQSLKAAPSAPVAQSEANAEWLRGYATATPATKEAADRVSQYTQQQKFVRGRTFYQNGEVWTDANVQKMQTAKRVQVKFNSQEYFDLIAKNQDALPWFAVGPDVDVVIGDTVYECRQ
jgi:Ca-activated chloride channel family protein